MTTIFRITMVLALVIMAGCGPEKPAAPETEQTLLNLISLKFENPDAHYKLAKLYHVQQQWIKAEYEYNIAIGFSPDNQWPEAGLVKMYEDWGRSDKAQAAMDKAMRSCVTDEEMVMLAKALGKEGLHKQAQECYEYALAVAKNKGGIYKEMGYYYLTIGDKVRAEGAFRKSLELRPYQPDVSAELGRMGVKVVAPEIVHQKPAAPGAVETNTKLEEEIVNKK
jgi:tetratricopeptide (TPR) repeat protein